MSHRLAGAAMSALVHNGIVVERGRSKELQKKMRANGGPRKGWEVQMTNKQVGDACELSAYCKEQMAKEARGE